MPISPAAVSSSAMHGALVPIATMTGNGTSSVELRASNIPQNFQDLLIQFNGTPTNSSGFGVFGISGGNGSNGGFTYLFGNGSLAQSGRAVNNTGARFDGITNLSSSYPVSATFHILNYANTSTYKTLLCRSAADYNGSGTTNLVVSMVQSTAAVTSFFIQTGVAGTYWSSSSTMTLYGIRSVGQ